MVNDRGFSVRKEIMVLSNETFNKELQKYLYQWGIPAILILTLIIFITIRQSQKQNTQRPAETSLIPKEDELRPIPEEIPPFEIPKEDELQPTEDAAPPSEILREDELSPTLDETPPFELQKENEFRPTAHTRLWPKTLPCAPPRTSSQP